jgi:hypothetical protein
VELALPDLHVSNPNAGRPSVRYSVERDHPPALGAFDFNVSRALVALESGADDIHVPKGGTSVPDIHPSVGVHGSRPVTTVPFLMVHRAVSYDA